MCLGPQTCSCLQLCVARKLLLAIAGVLRCADGRPLHSSVPGSAVHFSRVAAAPSFARCHKTSIRARHTSTKPKPLCRPSSLRGKEQSCVDRRIASACQVSRKDACLLLAIRAPAHWLQQQTAACCELLKQKVQCYICHPKKLQQVQLQPSVLREWSVCTA